MSDKYWVETVEAWLQRAVDRELEPEQVTALLWTLGIGMDLAAVCEWVQLTEDADAIEGSPDDAFYAALEDSGEHANAGPEDRFDWAMSVVQDIRDEAHAKVVAAVASRSMQLVIA